MGVKRIVSTDFWTDDKVIDMFSPEDKLFMLYLLTNPHTTQLGVYRVHEKEIAFEIGYSVDAVRVLLDRFENKYQMIRVSKETNEIAIKNFLKHSIIKGGAPVKDCLIREIKNAKNKDLVSWVFENIEDDENLNETVKQVIKQYNYKNGVLVYTHTKEYKNDFNNENENENDVSFGTSERIVQEHFEQIKEDVLKEDLDDKICEWCGAKTSILHNHHYPIPKRLGGKEIVKICPNCHSKFHTRERELFEIDNGYSESSGVSDSLFNEFWEAYPKKVNKKGTQTAFNRIKHLQDEFPLIMEALERFKKSAQWTKDNGQFIPHPTTWIHQERWKDEHIETREDKLKKLDMSDWL